MNTVEKLTEIFRTFPGIGPRQAKRFVYFLLTRNKSLLNELADLIKQLPNEVEICQDCFKYFTKGYTETKLCDICQSKNRDESSLMIVARDIDLENIEKSHSFNGKYFVLGGTVPILDKEPGDKIRLRELLATIEKKANSRTTHNHLPSQTQDSSLEKEEIQKEKEGLREIILGFSINPESEYTADFVTKEISPLINKYQIKISHLGRGLSTGTELEYSDADTIKSALENRR